MYADRYARPAGIKPGSLTVAIGINAALIGALLFSSPAVQQTFRDPPLTTINVPIDPPPDPIQPETKAQPQQRATAQPERIEATTAIAGASTDFTVTPLPPLPPLPFPRGEATMKPVDPPAPVMIGATLDPRYARDLQPQYPAGERRIGREGSVQLRVTIGADGRVTAAECLAATSDAFCTASVRQALAKWRFRPATRDGVAIESSAVKTVRFELEA